jgi:hypothetical protein
VLVAALVAAGAHLLLGAVQPGPGAVPTVAMSTPWSSVHALGGTATAGFWNGNRMVDPTCAVTSPTPSSGGGALSGAL